MCANGKPKIAVFCWEAGQVPKGLVQMDTLAGNSLDSNAYSFPIKLCRIEGANVDTVLDNPSPVILARMIEKARELSDEGIKAITTSCGFNAIFQKGLAEALDIPVFTSSLLQVPYLHNVLPANKSIAVITAKRASLKQEHFNAVGITKDMNVIVFGLEDYSPEWHKIFLEQDKEIDLDIVSAEIIATAITAVHEHPNIGSFVMECTDLPPFSQAIREKTGKPVFDFVTMMQSIANLIGIH